MLRYVRNQPPRFGAQALLLEYAGRCYWPCLQHTAVRQDRPIGRAETWRPHRHNLYHVVVFTQARGAFTLGGRTVSAEPGTVVCVSPGQSHDFVTHRGQAVYSEVTFSLETPDGQVLDRDFGHILERLAGTPLDWQPWRHLAPEVTRQLESLIQEITDHARSGAEIAEYCWQRSLGLLLERLVWSCDPQGAATASVDARLVAVKRFIEQHYAEAIAADDLATLAKVSKGYLFRAFKRAYRQAPLAYQQQLRLEAARTLLRATALRCGEVARRCGYENAPFFHRLFKRATGLTPGQYRKHSTGPTPP